MSFETESSDTGREIQEYNIEPGSEPTRYSYSSDIDIDPSDEMPDR